jgi:flavin-dependent dehydrogenase
VRRYYTSPKTHDDYLESWLELWDGPPNESNLLPGYGWIFGMGDGTVNAGLGVLNSSAGFGKTDYRGLLTRWLDNTPEEWGLREPNATCPTRGAALPMGFNRTPHYSPGLLLLGDAGGMVSPFNGEGISYAMESARFAAGFIIDAAARQRAGAWDSSSTSDADAHLARYAGYVRDQWGSHFTLGRAFAALIGKPAVMKLALRTGMPIPVLMRFVVRLLANLTDPAAKGFEDRVIRVLELLVPATSNTGSFAPSSTNSAVSATKVRVNP